MNYTATISSKGQITIPAKIRRSLNLDVGDRITITKHGDKVTIVPDSYDERLADLRRRTAEHLRVSKIKPLQVDEMDKIINDSWAKADVDSYKNL